MPKLSVIVPVYGVEKYIARCARSLLEQTLDDIEFIFVDDCTPDSSMEILAQEIEKYRLCFAEMNHVIRTERMSMNSGLAAVRRHGIQLATGDFVIHCDSDDWVDKDAYLHMYETAIREDADCVLCNYACHDGKQLLVEKKGCISTNKDEYLQELFYQRSEWPVWNRMVRRDICTSIKQDPVCNMGEDMVLSLQYTIKCKQIALVPKPLYFYFENPASIVRTVTLESVVSKFRQSDANVRVLSEALKEESIKDHKILEGLEWLYYRSSNTLLPFIRNKEVRQIWRKHYDQYNWKFLKHSRISIGRKIRHVLITVYLFMHK